jgi:HK97 family phage portal protein
VNIFSTDTFPSRIIKYNVNLWPTVYYQKEEILHEKYWNPNWEVNGTQLYGISPLKSALRLLQRNNSSLTASASTYDNEGIKGILHMKTQPGSVDGELLVQEVSRLKDRMISEWSGAENRGRIGLGGYDMGWIPIGLNSEEMQLIESEKWDLRRLCSVYGVQSQLLNDPENKTYNNQKEEEKALTCRAALPTMTSARDNLNRKATAEWGLPKGNMIDFDMSVYSELQSDVKDTATWTSQLIAISPNEQRELCGLAALPDESMNEPWINPNGRQAKSEYDMNEVDNALNNGEGNY